MATITKGLCGCVTFLTVVLAGCGGSPPISGRQDVSFASSADIRDALANASLTCSNYETKASGDREWWTEDAADESRCKVENEDIVIIVWKDNGQRDNWAGITKNMGCMMNKAFGVSTVDYVFGDHWTIADVSQTLAKKISVIGGKAEHIVCGGQPTQ
jgi:hypothetical protein